MPATVIAGTACMMQAVFVPAWADGCSCSKLTNLLEADVSCWPVRAGLYVKHLGTREWLDLALRYQRRRHRGGSSILKYKDDGLKLTLDEHA